MILFKTPGVKQSIEIGMIMTLWKGLRKPKQFSGEVAVNSVVAFRVIALEQANTDRRD